MRLTTAQKEKIGVGFLFLFSLALALIPYTGQLSGTESYYKARLVQYAIVGAPISGPDPQGYYELAPQMHEPPVSYWVTAGAYNLVARVTGAGLDPSLLLGVMAALPALFGALTVVLAYYLLKELFRQRLAALGAVLLALSPLLLAQTIAGFYSEAALGLLLFTAAALLLLRSLRSGSLPLAAGAGILLGANAATWSGAVWGFIALYAIVGISILRKSAKLPLQNAAAFALPSLLALAATQFWPALSLQPASLALPWAAAPLFIASVVLGLAGAIRPKLILGDNKDYFATLIFILVSFVALLAGNMAFSALGAVIGSIFIINELIARQNHRLLVTIAFIVAISLLAFGVLEGRMDAVRAAVLGGVLGATFGAFSYQRQASRYAVPGMVVLVLFSALAAGMAYAQAQVGGGPEPEQLDAYQWIAANTNSDAAIAGAPAFGNWLAFYTGRKVAADPRGLDASIDRDIAAALLAHNSSVASGLLKKHGVQYLVIDADYFSLLGRLNEQASASEAIDAFVSTGSHVRDESGVYYAVFASVSGRILYVEVRVTGMGAADFGDKAIIADPIAGGTKQVSFSQLPLLQDKSGRIYAVVYPYGDSAKTMLFQAFFGQTGLDEVWPLTENGRVKIFKVT